AQWRQARTVPQPAGAPAAVATTASAAPAPATGARLEIAPALAADAAHAGTTTGTAAGSEGDMLGNEQLRQAKEDIATRDAEIGELKQRVAELEKLKDQQQSLIALKDNDLAAAQQRLEQPAGATSAGTPWYWLGLPLLLLIAGAAWLMRRRKPSPLPPLRDESDAAALAAAVPAGAALDTLAEQSAWASPASGDARQEPAMPEWATAADTHQDAEDTVSAQADASDATTPLEDTESELPAAVATLPQWDALEPEPEPEAQAEAARLDAVPAETQAVGVPDYALHAEQQPQFRGVFDLPAEPHEDPAVAASDAADDVEEVPVAAQPDAHDWAPRPGQERLELAIAYLDLGDAQTARTLLQEVAEQGDVHCQAQARELLARLD
ncbi:FimV/HubP family polar landmark protein, partial [Stenotrophomonas sp.]|uniref:FimV/HubP family polar landmark protein n=1 Tax=Stenotrophomonas sp. TaxID=69392 RepID=UPI0028AB1552